MPARTRRLMVATLSLAALAAPQAAQAAHKPVRAHASEVACTWANRPLAGRHLNVARRATLCLLNRVRHHHGLHALKVSTPLRTAAFGHSRDMVRHRYFDHGQFVTRIARAGYMRGARGYTVGENILWGGGSRQTPASAVDAWMNSPEHRANILSSSYREIGVGIAMGTPMGMAGGTYTTDFGLRR